MSTDWSFYPRVISYFLNCWSILRFVGNHFDKKVFKRFIEKVWNSVSRMCFPKYSLIVLFNEFIVGIRWNSSFKRRITSIHDKKNNSCSKNISFSSFIIFCGNLRSHVAFSSKFCMKNSTSISSFYVTSKPKISKFQSEIFA